MREPDPGKGLDERVATHFAGLAVLGSVYEDDRVDPGNLFCHLRRKLMRADDFDLRSRELRAQFFGCSPSDAVVAAKWIAIREDQNPNQPPSTLINQHFKQRHIP